MEMRTSPLFPWLFMAWLDPLTGNSTEVPLPDQSYENYDIDPEIFPEQWPGSTRRVWAYDPVTQQAMSNAWLREQGLLSIKDLWCKAQGYSPAGA